jgi:AraC family transcriptional regulator, ethanolamine operon transcriptional activator
MSSDGIRTITHQPATTGPAWAYSSRYDDIDAQAAHFQGFGQHYQQLSAGRFDGQFHSFNFGPELAIHREGANRELVQSATTPHGRFGLSLLAEKSPPCVLHAATIGEDEIILYPSGQTIEGKTPERMQILCIDLDARLLLEDEHATPGVQIVCDTRRASELREVVRAGIATFQSLGEPCAYPAAMCSFTSSVADLVWHVASFTASERLRVRRRARTRALVVYSRARDRFVEGLANGVSISQVCRSIGVSRRSLECAFRSVLGMSPAHYVRTLQLNCIRRDLLCAEELQASIGVIAARHGVWHWSRCSQAYRRLFGELPSETRRRLLMSLN